nr:MAG TPA: hypothetical protein [Caudoviricetes sp.]
MDIFLCFGYTISQNTVLIQAYMLELRHFFRKVLC